MKKLNVGVIGLGEVAQIIHLPILEALAERYTIAALCDISQQLLQQLGRRYQVSRLFTDYRELVELPDLDVVFVLNSDEYHADCTIAAAHQGKHVLVEKPMCLTLEEADAIIEARDKAGVQVMVGYMRRYAPAFVEAVEHVRRLEKINYARVRDIIGANRLIIEQSSTVLRPQDIPQAAIDERTQRAQNLVATAIGDVAPEIARAYRLLCGLSSHDLSAMRELLGMPQRVVAATLSNNGRFLNAIFDHDGFYTSFETGVDSQRRFDAHIEVYGETKSIRVQYDTPYIRHLPTTLHLSETRGDAFDQQSIRPTFTDPYTCELLALYDAVALHSQKIKTTPEDFKQDLILFKHIITLLTQQV